MTRGRTTRPPAAEMYPQHERQKAAVSWTAAPLGSLLLQGYDSADKDLCQALGSRFSAAEHCRQ
jgi:hypothetical protein